MLCVGLVCHGFQAEKTAEEMADLDAVCGYLLGNIGYHAAEVGCGTRRQELTVDSDVSCGKGGQSEDGHKQEGLAT